MPENPYRATDLVESPPAEAARAPASEEAAKVLLWARMLLKVVGLLLVVDGAASGAFAMIYSLRVRGFEEYPDYYITESLFALAYAVSAAVQLLSGIYLVFGGNLVVDRVFAPLFRSRSADDQP
jgi:hypothetical protein